VSPIGGALNETEPLQQSDETIAAISSLSVGGSSALAIVSRRSSALSETEVVVCVDIFEIRLVQ
jgi:hypothetical protein